MVKKCSGTKGYACGRACISVKKICRRDGLTGQSVTLLNNFVAAIPSAATKTDDARWLKADSEKVQLQKHFEPFGLNEKAFPLGPKSSLIESALTKNGFTNVQGMGDAIVAYSFGSSLNIKLVDAGKKEEPTAKKYADKINSYIKQAPKYQGQITSGFEKDMIDVYKVDTLKLGSKFSFPSITSFSSAPKTAKAFNGGGTFTVLNNKSGASVMPFSQMRHENEVLVSKKAKYRVKDIIPIKGEDQAFNYILEEI